MPPANKVGVYNFSHYICTFYLSLFYIVYFCNLQPVCMYLPGGRALEFGFRPLELDLASLGGIG